MNRPLILITRAAEDAVPLVEMLEARGYATLCEPMLILRPAPQQAAPLLEQAINRNPQATIITSQHALPALLPYSQLTFLPLFVVGAATADAAKRHGFIQITHAPDASTLLTRILPVCKPSAGPLLYTRGQHVAYNIGSVLHRQGFKIEEVTAYNMRSVLALSPTLLTALADHTMHSATFLSVRTVETFLNLLQDTPHTSQLAHVNAVAFSQPIADALAIVPWRHIAVCEQPTLASLLDTMDKLATGS